MNNGCAYIFCAQAKRHIDTYPATLIPNSIYCTICHKHAKLRQLQRVNQRTPGIWLKHFYVHKQQKRLIERIGRMGFKLEAKP